MELELKHIAGYFPYKLKCKVMDDSGVTFYVYGTEYYNKIIYGKHSWYKNTTKIEKVKPLLRPITDLSKIDKDNNKTYLEVIYDMMWITPSYEKVCFEWVQEFQGFALNGEGSIITIEVLEYLHKHHFDIHDLIYYDLAIDINTISL